MINTSVFVTPGWYFGLLSDQLFSREQSTSVQRLRGAQLREALVTSGSVALIKSGQALSLRPDLLKNGIWAIQLVHPSHIDSPDNSNSTCQAND